MMHGPHSPEEEAMLREALQGCGLHKLCYKRRPQRLAALDHRQAAVTLQAQTSGESALLMGRGQAGLPTQGSGQQVKCLGTTQLSPLHLVMQGVAGCSAILNIELADVVQVLFRPGRGHLPDHCA